MNHTNGFLALTRKELVRVFRIWKQTLIPPVTTSVLYFLIFGTFIGSQISDIGGLSYMQFIVPGFIMMSVITASYANVSSSFFGAKFTSSIEEVLVSPLPNFFVLAAYCLGGILRGIIVGILIYLVSILFVDISISSYWLSFLFLVLTSTLFTLFGLFNAFFANSFDDVMIIPTFVITPLTYLGGVFYSLSFLPEFWQSLSLFNPVYYMVNGLRYAMVGYSEVSVLYSVVALIIAILIALVVNLVLLKKWYGLKS